MNRNIRESERKPAAGLSAQARRLWREIYQQMKVDAPGVMLLDDLCQHFDRARQARLIVAREGFVIVETTAAGKERRRPHPASVIEAQATAAMHRAWKLLGFDVPPQEGS